MEFTLLGAAALGVGAMWMGTRIDQDLREETPDPYGMLLGSALVGLIVGRLVAMIATGTNPLSLDFILVRGGVSTIAAAMAAVLWLGWSTRGQWHVMDALAPAALLGVAGWHAGCLIRSTCLGAATSLPWGWSVPGSTVDRHPVELYAAIAVALGAFLVRRITRGGSAPGSGALTAIGVAGLARFLTEPLRLTLGNLLWFYGLATLLGLAGAAILVTRRSIGIHENG